MAKADMERDRGGWCYKDRILAAIRMLADLSGHTFHGSLCWSHDGKQVAFDATVGGAQNDHIFIVDVAGGKPRDLGLGSQPSWSGDGNGL